MACYALLLAVFDFHMEIPYSTHMEMQSIEG